MMAGEAEKCGLVSSVFDSKVFIRSIRWSSPVIMTNAIFFDNDKDKIKINVALNRRR